MSGVKLCKRGHERTPENVTKNGTCKLCKLEWGAANPEKVREYSRKWGAANPEKVREKYQGWAAVNPEKVRDGCRKQVENMKRSYIAGCLGLRVSEVPQELLELKRNQLLFKREMKQLKKTIGD